MARGFTLIELIIVIILLGIMGTFVFNYVGFSAQIYSDATAREQLISQSRFAMERLTAELRNALPRSVRVSADNDKMCLEYMPIITSSQYLYIPRTPTDTSPLHGFAPVVPAGQSLVGKYLVVGAVNSNYIYGVSDQRRKEITAVTINDAEIEIEFSGTAHFSGSSPAQRYYVTNHPVSWCYNQTTQKLWRFTGYGLQAITPTLRTLEMLKSGGGIQAEVMATGMTNNLTLPIPEYPFLVDEATLVRTSLIQLDWRFTHPRTDESIQLLHEVHIANVP